MSISDRNLVGPPGEEPENIPDRVPPSERGQDQLRADTMHGLGVDGSRELTSEERDAAEHDTPLRERVYAPASQRVPKEPAPGHRDMIEHTDPLTPERQGVMTEPDASAEPSFTRVPRPATAPVSEVTPTPVPTPYASPMSNPALDMDVERGQPLWQTRMPAIASWCILAAAAALGAWLFARWREERNKPINRIRRQAKHTAAEIREHVPSGEDVLRPAMGLAAAVVSTAVVLLRQVRAQQRTLKRASETISDADWQKRLVHLKQRWHPGRVELEKIQISRH